MSYTHMYILSILKSAREISASPSHRRGTLKGVPTVKSPTSHFKSLKGHVTITFSWNPF